MSTFYQATAASNPKVGARVKRILTMAKKQPITAEVATAESGAPSSIWLARTVFAILKLLGAVIPKMNSETTAAVNQIINDIDKRSLRSVLVAKQGKTNYLIHTLGYKQLSLDPSEIPADSDELDKKFGPAVCFDITESTGKALAPLLTSPGAIVATAGDVAYVYFEAGDMKPVEFKVSDRSARGKAATKAAPKAADKGAAKGTEKKLTRAEVIKRNYDAKGYDYPGTMYTKRVKTPEDVKFAVDLLAKNHQQLTYFIRTNAGAGFYDYRGIATHLTDIGITYPNGKNNEHKVDRATVFIRSALVRALLPEQTLNIPNKNAAEVVENLAKRFKASGVTRNLTVLTQGKGVNKSFAIVDTSRPYRVITRKGEKYVSYLTADIAGKPDNDKNAAPAKAEPAKAEPKKAAAPAHKTVVPVAPVKDGKKAADQAPIKVRLPAGTDAGKLQDLLETHGSISVDLTTVKPTDKNFAVKVTLLSAVVYAYTKRSEKRDAFAAMEKARGTRFSPAVTKAIKNAATNTTVLVDKVFPKLAFKIKGSEISVSAE